MIETVKQFLKFGIVGFVNTVLNYIIYYVLVNNKINYLIANAISFIITVAVSYILNGLFTFKDSGKQFKWSFSKLIKSYCFYFFTGIVINSIMLFFLIEKIGVDKNIAPIFILAVTVPINFVFNKFWVFENKDTKKYYI